MGLVLTLLVVLVVMTPFAVVFGLLAWAGRRQRLRHDVEIRQIALIDRIHARFGAVAAPVVRRHRDGWQVRIAVPFDCPTIATVVLAIVRDTFAPAVGRRGALEIIVTRQADGKPTGAGPVRWESLPCT